MAALCLLLAIVAGVAVGDLVLENTAAGDVTMLHYSVSGSSEGLLLATAAGLGFVLGLLLLASLSTTRTRRARRRWLRTAGRDLSRQAAELERENARLREELARTRRVRHLGELGGPADLRSAAWARPAAERRVAAPSGQPERHPEPIYEQARRAARLRSNPDPQGRARRY
jgi:hypothetical protein